MAASRRQPQISGTIAPMSCPHHSPCSRTGAGAPASPAASSPRRRRRKPRRDADILAQLLRTLDSGAGRDGHSHTAHLWLPDCIEQPPAHAAGRALQRLMHWLHQLDLHWLLMQFLRPSKQRRAPRDDVPVLRGGWHIDTAQAFLRRIAPAHAGDSTGGGAAIALHEGEGPALWSLGTLRALPLAPSATAHLNALPTPAMALVGCLELRHARRGPVALLSVVYSPDPRRDARRLDQLADALAQQLGITRSGQRLAS